LFRLTLFLSLLVSFFFPLNYPLSKDQFVILFDQTMLGKHIHTHTHTLPLSFSLYLYICLSFFLSVSLYLSLSLFPSVCISIRICLSVSVSLSFYVYLYFFSYLCNFQLFMLLCYSSPSFSISVLSLLLFWFLFEDLFSFLSEGIAYQNRFSFYVIGSCFDFPFHVEAIKIVPHPRLKTDFLPIKSSLFCKWITG
jgi:hypothetical protein